jgi:hypothetical protein
LVICDVRSPPTRRSPEVLHRLIGYGVAAI